MRWSAWGVHGKTRATQPELVGAAGTRWAGAGSPIQVDDKRRGLVRQIEKGRAQAIQVVTIGIEKMVNVLGSAHESGLDHGHAAHDDVTHRFPVQAPAQGEQIG